MFVGLGHVSAGPFILGLLMAIGVMVLLYRIANFQIGHISLSLLIWYTLYNLHGGSTEGGMAVMIAALILDLVAMPILRFFYRRKA